MEALSTVRDGAAVLRGDSCLGSDLRPLEAGLCSLPRVDVRALSAVSSRLTAGRSFRSSDTRFLDNCGDLFRSPEPNRVLLPPELGFRSWSEDVRRRGGEWLVGCEGLTHPDQRGGLTFIFCWF